MISRCRRLFSPQIAAAYRDRGSASVAELIENLDREREKENFDFKSHEVTSALNSIVLRKNDLGESVFKLLPIIKASRNTTAAWKIVSILENQLLHASFSQLSIASWHLAKLKILDPAVWQVIRSRFLTFSPSQESPKMVTRAVWGICNSGVVTPEIEILELKRWIERSDFSKFSIQDLVMTLGSLCHLCPKDTPLLSEISDLLTPLTAGASLPTCAIVSLWRSAERMQPPPAALIELLAEQSRTLRLDPAGFTDEACAQVARAAAVTQSKDPRVMYQLIYFVKTYGLKTRYKPYLSLVKSFAKLGITDEVAWKRFATRLEKHGPALTVKELQDVERSFQKADRLTPRVNGILQCFFAIKEDFDKYGPS